MTDATTTDDPPPSEPGAEVGEEVEPAADATPEVARRHDDALRTRFLLPLLVPILSMIAVAIYVLNVSRVFLSGDPTSALVIATIITISILVGGTLISFHGRLRSSTLAMLLGLVVVIVIATGLTTLGPSIKTNEGNAGGPLPQPKGAPASTVDVTAEASIKFNADAYTAKAGIVRFDYGGAAGHTLQIQEVNYQGFPLSSDGTPKSGQVTLKPGKYTIYCTVDSHRQQGMVATVTVTP